MEKKELAFKIEVIHNKMKELYDEIYFLKKELNKKEDLVNEAEGEEKLKKILIDHKWTFSPCNELHGYAFSYDEYDRSGSFPKFIRSITMYRSFISNDALVYEEAGKDRIFCDWSLTFYDKEDDSIHTIICGTTKEFVIKL